MEKVDKKRERERIKTTLKKRTLLKCDCLFQSELLFQESSAVWGQLVRVGLRDGETEGGRNAKRQRTWKTCLSLRGSQLGLWNSERRPTWSLVLLEQRAVSLLLLTPVSLWLSNQSLAEPLPVPLFSILMNYGNYLSRFWSVYHFVPPPTVTVNSFCHPPVGCGFMWTKYGPGCNAEGLRRSWGTRAASTHGTTEPRSQRRQNEAQHQIKALLVKRCYL